MSHRWSGYPGAYCLRCGAGQVLELALADNWLKESYGPLEDGGHVGKWKSDDHRRLVEMCDGHCYADMTPEEVEAHKAAIKALQDKLGIK